MRLCLNELHPKSFCPTFGVQFKICAASFFLVIFVAIYWRALRLLHPLRNTGSVLFDIQNSTSFVR